MAAPAARPPIPPSALIGREGEIARVCELLAEGRLVTLTGPGGTGKTRLALAVLRELEGSYPDSVAFVDLAPLADPALLPSAIAQALGLQEGPGRPVAETLQVFLERRSLLLCLDNFEHLLAAAALVSRLLDAASDLRVLATSRAPLRLAGEREHQVPPLQPAEASELFVARAQQAKDGFALTEENRTVVTEICERLDRLPLAIELAAARVRVLPPEKLRERLGERLPLLTQGARDAPARQRTLQATIDWSYGLLGRQEQALMARLSVFAGGCTLEAAEAVCDAELDTLTSLVEQSLLREEDVHGEPRYSLLETVREYALERLRERGEQDAYRHRHLDYFLALAAEAGPALFGSTRLVWLDRLELELDNLRAAMSLTLDRGVAEQAERLAAAFSTVLHEMSRLRESRRWLEAALALDGGVEPAVRAATLHMLGHVTFRHGEFERARALLEEAVRLLRMVGDGGRHVHVLGLLAWVTQRSGDRDAAVRLVDEIVPLLPQLRLWSYQCQVRTYLGWVYAETGDHDRAHAFFEEARQLGREHADPAFVATSLNAIGWLAMLGGDYERARSVKEEGLAIARESRHSFTIALALGGLGVLCVLQEDFARAAAILPENFRLISERGDARLAAESLVAAAGYAAASGQAVTATRLAGATEAMYERMGAEWNPMERLVLERHVWPQRERLGAAFDDAWAHGRAMTFDEAIVLALEISFAGTDLRPGTDVAGYRIEAVVGRGGMGVVYLAEQLRLKRRVALKLLAPELAGNERFRERFLRESELAASLDHPNVVDVYDAGETDGLLYLAMRYVDGTDLGTLLTQEGRLEPGRAVAIVGPVADALDAGHALGLVHRDVKPGNVLLALEGGVYLADFGLTRHADEGSPAEKQHLSGTLEYVAPEQIEGEPPDPRVDVYSLGCVLYHCLAGETPFPNDSPMALLWAHFDAQPPSLRERRPELPAPIDAVIARALAKEPGERYPSCGELAAAAAAALGVGQPGG